MNLLGNCSVSPRRECKSNGKQSCLRYIECAKETSPFGIWLDGASILKRKGFFFILQFEEGGL